MVTVQHAVTRVGVVLVTVGCLAGCAGGNVDARPSQGPEAAAHEVTSLVDRASDALGGAWTVVSGPRLGPCPGEVGQGVAYTYVKRRDDRGDTEADLRTLERLWSDAGLETSRFTWADGAMRGLEGSGAMASAISFRSSDLGGGDTLRGTSRCAAGDYVEMRERGEE